MAGCESSDTGASTTSIIWDNNLVPDVPMDVYLFASQDKPTVLPDNAFNTSEDISIESLSIWGVPSENYFSFGISLVFSSSNEASSVYKQIKQDDFWMKLRDNNIFVVYGEGSSAESLKSAIELNHFKKYDDSEMIEASTFLPEEVDTKRAAIALARPSNALIELLFKGSGNTEMVSNIKNLVQLKVVSAGLYSPEHIPAEAIIDIANNEDSICNYNIGVVVALKSGYPGLLVQNLVEAYLKNIDLKPVQLGELTVYKGYWETEEKDIVYALIRLEDNRIFCAVSGRLSYAETLITSVRLK